MVIYTVRSKEKYDGEGVLDVDEAFDGTWMTHGHKSHVGAGVVMEILTGFRLDSEVLTNRKGGILKRKH